MKSHPPPMALVRPQYGSSWVQGNSMPHLLLKRPFLPRQRAILSIMLLVTVIPCRDLSTMPTERERDELIESSCRTKLVGNLTIDRLYAYCCVFLCLWRKRRSNVAGSKHSCVELITILLILLGSKSKRGRIMLKDCFCVVTRNPINLIKVKESGFDH